MEGKKRRHPPSKTERILSAGIAGVVLGGIGGTIIGASFNSALLGAILGAILIGPAEAITDNLRKEGESKPWFYRMLVMSFVGAVLGAILGMLFKGLSLTASENENLTVVKLPPLNEGIEVLVENENLSTEIRFYLAGLNFLTLYYSIDRIDT